MIIAIDFDGTVVTHMYPEVGEDIGAVPYLKKIVESGNEIILCTMRSKHNGTLQDAINWYKDNGIPLYGVNSNPTQKRWTDSPKIYAHCYIDDAALGIPTKFDEESGREYVDWPKLGKILVEKGIIDEDVIEESKKKVYLTESQLKTIIKKEIEKNNR